MSKFEIKVEGLPEGWVAVEFRTPLSGENIIDYKGELICVSKACFQPRLIVKKKQPRRIVLEETEEKVNGICQHWVRTDGSTADFRIISENKWREVQETEEIKK